MQPLDIKDLVVLLRTNAGDSDTYDLDGDVLDVPFSDLNYDSLALLQVTGAIERDNGVALDEEALEEAETPRQYLDVVNQVLADASRAA
ncbi:MULTISPECIES: phosphopantetheine-binding protein [Streptomycetaceae]|uniref:phosphopantetheine-binding protein n=1 Tax=Streptomycetaceae TaxID=2062 RepID=UPI000FCC0EBE|nr:phosphopantetheine-binding protein [Actinacidiphila soli]